MATKKPRIVIIGAGMAGLTAAHKLYTSAHPFDLHVVDGGNRIGGRINSSQFCGDRVELGATWIHGIEGSPVHKIAQDRSLLHSHHPWECMDGLPDHPVTVAEGGHLLHPSVVDPISTLFKNLMDFIQGKDDCTSSEVIKRCCSNGNAGNLSVGSFLRKGLEAYWGVAGEERGGERVVGKWRRRPLEEAVFAMHENTQRSFTAADDLKSLDYAAERDYVMFPGEEITIARGYSSVVEALASVLPAGMIELGRKVEKIEWQIVEHLNCKPVKLHFSDGTTLSADHVIITVSLGVLKSGIKQDSAMFDPPLPNFKIGAISRLGFGVVNKVFLKMKNPNNFNFPFLQMAFHHPNSDLKDPSVPNWIRKTSSIYPIYNNSRVVLSWFTGKEALHLESLSDDDIINGFSSTTSNLLSSNDSKKHEESPNCNGNRNNSEFDAKFGNVLRTQWGSNPLFLGSYSYVATGSSIADMDTLSEPLPERVDGGSSPPLQILFAGEATHSTHYSTTHGAYFSGLREADRLLKHYELSAL